MIIRGKYLIDCSGRVVEDAFLQVSGGNIARLDSGNPSSARNKEEYMDLGDCSIILPGLVNAHTHLELTLARKCGRPEALFTDWLREIIQATGDWGSEDFADSLREGIRQSIEAGTTAVGDIANQVDATVYGEFPLRVRMFHEVIDFNPLTAETTIARLKDKLAKRTEAGLVSLGISPHTPYTVSEKLLRMCIEMARAERLHVCIHLSETSAETEFLQKGTGEILQFRKEHGLPQGWSPPGKTPVQYVRDLGLLDQPVTLVHCNYLHEDDLDILSASDCSVVFCPGSHSYFRHRRHPVKEMLERKIDVALGTDSRASSPSLSILEEMKLARNLYPDVAPLEILKMATAKGRKALAFPYGPELLQPDCPADITAISAAPEEMETAGNPLESVFGQSTRPIFSMVNGEILFRSIQCGGHS